MARRTEFKTYPLITDVDGNITATRGALKLEGELSIFPNPATGPVTVDFSTTNSADHRLCLFDVSGRIILEKKYPASQDFRAQLNVSELPGGTFFVRVTDGKGRMAVQKILRL